MEDEEIRTTDADGVRVGLAKPSPEGPESTPLSERGKGIDMVDTSTPPVDEWRPALDAPSSSTSETGVADAPSDTAE